MSSNKEFNESANRLREHLSQITPAKKWDNTYDGENLGFQSNDLKTLIYFITLFFTVLSVSLWAGFAAKTFNPPEKVKSVASLQKLSDFCIVDFIDVGQGDCILVRVPLKSAEENSSDESDEGDQESSFYTVLIDAGKSAGMYSSFDAGKKVTIPFLKSQGISVIDQVIMTHAHDDHVGGLISVLEDESIEIKEVLDPQFPATTRIYKRFLNLINKRRIKYTVVKDGQKLDWGENCYAKVISPLKMHKAGALNNSSIVIRMVYGKVAFMLTGDAEKEAEEDMLSYGKELSSQIIKVPHHGGETSSSPDFLALVKPEVAIFQVGANNKFGHPKSSILKLYQKVGAKIYRSDFNGTITVLTNGDTYEVKTEK
jgi:competence protein ComEC